MFCSDFAPNVPINLVSQMSWFQSLLCGFGAEINLLLRACRSSLPPPASSLQLLCSLPHSTKPLGRFGGADKGPHVSPGSREGGCALLLCALDPGNLLVI